MSRRRPKRWLGGAVNLAVVVTLLTAVSFLPPDTSLADRLKAGVLKLCVPPSFPPLVTSDPIKPGFDVELVQAIAQAIDLRLTVNVLPSIGQDFNPRNWFLTRAQCDIVAGGVADTLQTRSFMQTIPTQVETGWIAISATGTMPPSGSVVAVLPGTAGLDRLALSGWLRDQQIRAKLVRNPRELVLALETGTVDGAITERFAAAGLEFDTGGFEPFWLQDVGFEHYSMALGLWKGDQTLNRAVSAAVNQLEGSGMLQALRERYDLSSGL